MTFAARLALFYATIFAALGIQLPFLPVWMSAKGLDDRTVGIVLALGGVSRILATPLAAAATDRFGALKGAMVLAASVAAVSTALLGTADGAIGIAAAFTVAAAASSILMPLADVYAMRSLPERGFAYGPVRLWGSVAFVVGNFGAGSLAALLGARDLVWAIAGASILTVAAAAALAPVRLPKSAEDGTRLSALRALAGTPAFLLVVGAASLIQGSHALFYAFGSLHWMAQGLDGTRVGALWAIGVGAEIILFALSRRLPFTPSGLLLFGAAGAVFRWGAMALDPPLALLPALQCFHALSFGATHLGALQIVGRAAPAGFAVTGQGVLSMANGAASALATAASGVLYGAFGAGAYAAMAAMALVGGLLVLLARQRLVTDGWR